MGVRMVVDDGKLTYEVNFPRALACYQPMLRKRAYDYLRAANNCAAILLDHAGLKVPKFVRVPHLD